MSALRTLIWCYVPVIHEGYLRWFAKYTNADIALVAEADILQRRYLVKDIRRIDPAQTQKMLARVITGRVMVVDKLEMRRLVRAYDRVIMPDEPLMRELWSEAQVECDHDFVAIFMRWHEGNILLESIPRGLSSTEEPESIWGILQDQARLSPDWWRQIACCITRDDRVILTAHNHPLPSVETPFYQGDPRAVFNKGVHLELSSFIHAEASAIAQAAREGIALEGTDMYVTTFPCPPCAKLVAESGIKRLFFGEGYSVLDGNDVLEAAGVEVIRFDHT